MPKQAKRDKKCGPKAYYTVWNKNEEVIAFGSASDCARMLKMSKDTFYCTVTRVLKKQNRKYAIFVDKT